MILLISVRLVAQIESWMEAGGEGVGLRILPTASSAEASVAIRALHQEGK